MTITDSTTTELLAGEPRFADADLATLARQDGAAAAWREAYARHGAQAPAHVSGDFAVGLMLPDGSTFLAVDRFAVKSLCYRQIGDALHFAERADALADEATEIDPQAIFDYLFFHFIPSPRTIYKGIYRLPPGHCAQFTHGQPSVTPYWTPRFEETRSANFTALRTEFRDLLADAVKTRIAGCEPAQLACFLSGGTDSSTLAGMLGQVSGEPATTYSIGFDAQGYDEMEFARIAARHFKTRHHEYYVTPGDLVQSIADVAAHFDQPFGNSSALPAYYCARIARADGITTMLAGDGGDELFGGNSRYAKQRIFGWYQHLPPAVRNGLMEPLLALPGATRLPLLRKASSYVEQARVPMPDRLHMYNLLLRLGMSEVLTQNFRQTIDADAPARQQREVWAQAQADSGINRQLWFDWRYTLAENDLPKVCGATQLAGVEVGFPMLDQRLVDFSLLLPPNYKLKGLKLRWFFKEALRGFLPDEIIAKKKQGFGLPFGIWATRHAPLKKLAESSLHSFAERGIIRADFIARLMNEHLPAYPGYYGEMVWILMMLEQWFQAHRPNYRIT